MKLQDLQVTSFVTGLDEKTKATLKGGLELFIGIGGIIDIGIIDPPTPPKTYRNCR